MKVHKRHLVTAALPYANGPVHIGHLAGNFLPADIYTRYLRANKKMLNLFVVPMNMVCPLPFEP
jgi:methionyl-tRNA synthetase